MSDYPDIPDDQIRAWIAFASQRGDIAHLARLRLVLSARAALAVVAQNFAFADVERSVVFANLDGTIYQSGSNFEVQFADGDTVRCHSLDVALLALRNEMKEG